MLIDKNVLRRYIHIPSLYIVIVGHRWFYNQWPSMNYNMSRNDGWMMDPTPWMESWGLNKFVKFDTLLEWAIIHMV